MRKSRIPPIIVVISMLLTACGFEPQSAKIPINASPTPSLQSVALYTLSEELEFPIVLVSGHRQAEGESLKFTCLNTDNCFQPVSGLSIRNILFDACRIDENGNLYIPLRWASDDLNSHREADLLFVDSQSKLPVWLTLSDRNSLNFQGEFIQPVFSEQGTMIFTDHIGNVIVLKEDTVLRKIILPTAAQGVLLATELGTKETFDYNVVSVSSIVEKDGKTFGLVYLINTFSGNLAIRLFPLPPYEPPPFPQTPQVGVKYGLSLYGVDKNLDKIYYSYSYVTSDGDDLFHTRLGMYDRKTGKEVDGPEIDASRRLSLYRGIFYTSSDPLGGGPIMVKMEGLTPIGSLAQIYQEQMSYNKFPISEKPKIQIVPFGEYFLLGTKDKIYLLSSDGIIQREYQLPQEIIDQEYTIIGFGIR